MATTKDKTITIVEERVMVKGWRLEGRTLTAQSRSFNFDADGLCEVPTRHLPAFEHIKEVWVEGDPFTVEFTVTADPDEIVLEEGQSIKGAAKGKAKS